MDEANERLLVIDRQEKEMRASFTKKEREIEEKEAELRAEAQRLAEISARLEEEKKTYKEKILKEMTDKLKGVK